MNLDDEEMQLLLEAIGGATAEETGLLPEGAARKVPTRGGLDAHRRWL
jgi:hypothetical protein